VLRAAGAAPVASLVVRLGDPDTREFALAALSVLGPTATAASPHVAALLSDSLPPERLGLAFGLGRLGADGVQRLGPFVEHDPTLLPALLQVLPDGDDPSRAAAARWLATLQLPDFTTVAAALQTALPQTRDEAAREALVFALLHCAWTPTPNDWLGLPNWDAAEVRQRLAASFAPFARGPLEWGVLAELLDDDNAGVRAAAAAALLAAPERVEACRRPLAEFAAKAPEELAAKVRAALGR
jgi:HEAT repeat protein